MPAELNTTAGGRALLREIDDYLEEFGWRSDAFELADPTWREDISIPMKVLRGLVALDDESDPDRLAREAVSVREALVDNALKVLGGNGDKLSTFRDLYASAVCYVGITEDHNFYIDQLGSAVLRLPLVELGRRLANRGALLDESDVFYIYVSEIRDGLQGTDFKDHVAQRKGEIEKWSSVIPPAFIGTPPQEFGSIDDPMRSGWQKMYGGPVEPSRDPDTVAGLAASPGQFQGFARVARTLPEASEVKPGEVLVCETTLPSWTPLFSTVGAVVTDTGGILSHCAIVAREYRIPCVVGTGTATSLIESGMKLTVDGSQGLVRIDTRP